MTNDKWNTAGDPAAMLRWCGHHTSDRKLRLFAAACARQVCHLLTDPRSLAALEVAERYADGLATVEELTAASDAAGDAASDAASAAWYAASAASAAASDAAGDAAGDAANAARSAAWDAAWAAAREAQCALLRDVYNPQLRPGEWTPAWVTVDARGIAQAIYAGRDFTHLPILADALEDAGCTYHEMLAHLRSPGPHVRGCWALDLVLGKK